MVREFGVLQGSWCDFTKNLAQAHGNLVHWFLDFRGLVLWEPRWIALFWSPRIRGIFRSFFRLVDDLDKGSVLFWRSKKDMPGKRPRHSSGMPLYLRSRPGLQSSKLAFQFARPREAPESSCALSENSLLPSQGLRPLATVFLSLPCRGRSLHEVFFLRLI